MNLKKMKELKKIDEQIDALKNKRKVLSRIVHVRERILEMKAKKKEGGGITYLSTEIPPEVYTGPMEIGMVDLQTLGIPEEFRKLLLDDLIQRLEQSLDVLREEALQHGMQC